ncbi:MAG TPA: hypothetical protein VF427_03625, partial [Noviherbaspirillum sp.]
HAATSPGSKFNRQGGSEFNQHEQFDGARYTAAHIPHARFIGYKSGGHVWVGHHSKVISEIAAFLE